LLLCAEMMRRDKWTVLLAPLVPLVPAGVAVDYFVDQGFIRRWGAAINGPRPAAPKPLLGPIPVREKQLA
jgi:hypothetical protein